jgi:hypothetical protein
MTTSLREHASACQARCTRAEFRLFASPQASDSFKHVISGQDMFILVLLALALVAAVALTAIWSASSERRSAAIEVLDRSIRWRP